MVADGDQVDTTLHSGRGAGAGPTASAVVADIADLASGAIAASLHSASRVGWTRHSDRAHMGRHQGAYYIRLDGARPAGRARRCLGILMRDHNVSIEALIQRARNPGEAVPIVLTTHETTEADMTDVLARISAASMPCSSRRA